MSITVMMFQPRLPRVGAKSRVFGLIHWTPVAKQSGEGRAKLQKEKLAGYADTPAILSLSCLAFVGSCSTVRVDGVLL